MKCCLFFETIDKIRSTSLNMDDNIGRLDYRDAVQMSVADSEPPCPYPVSPNMAHFSDRIRTFITWPHGTTKATPVQLAQAGFFYLGGRDRARCFYCNGGLQNWEYHDNPWFEHAKWFPNCDFVRHQKGTEFVQEVSNQFPELMRPEIQSLVQTAIHRVLPPSAKQVEQPAMGAVSFDVRNRSVDFDARENELVETAVKFGYTEHLVRYVVERSWQERGTAPDSVLELVIGCQEVENNIQVEHEFDGEPT